MFKTNIILQNAEKIDAILMELVQNSYNEVSEENLLLCMECGDVDLYIAAFQIMSSSKMLLTAILR